MVVPIIYKLLAADYKNMSAPIGLRLEKYTLIHRQEVLIVHLETVSGEPDTVMVYGGFSSSLMRATAFDADIPVIAVDSTIIAVDRLASPYDPSNPQYISSGLTLEAMEDMLQTMNI